MKTSILFVAILAVCNGCNSQPNKMETANSYRELEIELSGKDTCVFLQEKNNSLYTAYRVIEVLECSISDTALIGFSILRPQFAGKLMYLAPDDRTNSSMYAENFDDAMMLPKTDRLWFRSYHGSRPVGRIRIRLPI